jgi:phosphoserine/homoserine phosphotransferase
LNYKIIAVGDSYNDIAMLKEADSGILFNPPDNVKSEFPEFPVTFSYEELKLMIQKMLSNHSNPSNTQD